MPEKRRFDGGSRDEFDGRNGGTDVSVRASHLLADYKVKVARLWIKLPSARRKLLLKSAHNNNNNFDLNTMVIKALRIKNILKSSQLYRKSLSLLYEALFAEISPEVILAVLNRVLRRISDSGIRSTKKTKVKPKKSSKKYLKSDTRGTDSSRWMNNGILTEWSAIWSEIIRVISKSN